MWCAVCQLYNTLKEHLVNCNYYYSADEFAQVSGDYDNNATWPVSWPLTFMNIRSMKKSCNTAQLTRIFVHSLGWVSIKCHLSLIANAKNHKWDASASETITWWEFITPKRICRFLTCRGGLWTEAWQPFLPLRAVPEICILVVELYYWWLNLVPAYIRSKVQRS